MAVCQVLHHAGLPSGKCREEARTLPPSDPSRRGSEGPAVQGSKVSAEKRHRLCPEEFQSGGTRSYYPKPHSLKNVPGTDLINTGAQSGLAEDEKTERVPGETVGTNKVRQAGLAEL